ncbi:hypothetical protein REPUB_Repub14bG0007900 [Reevesia pubescens]
MPFPWKKARVTRFSRLVADLHQSPKRGGSLVVETGFPTSLIDLFVKNRDRLRKSPKRKSPPIQIESQTPATPLPSSPPQSFPSSPSTQEPKSPQIDVGKLVLIKRERECKEGTAFHAAFKFFVVVALAVSTKNLALWIMMAAFLFVLIEFVGTRFFGFLRPGSKMLFLGSWIRKVLLVFKRWDWEQGGSSSADKDQEGTTVFADSCGLNESEDDTCVEEIQIAEPKFDCVAVGKGCESLEKEIEKSNERLICKSEFSRRARIKRSFIKKFVPKKLRHAKKKQGKSKKEEIEEENQGLDDDDDGEDESQTEEGSCKGVLWVESETGTIKDEVAEEKNVRKGGKSGYPILFVIVLLAGLVGGRAVALLLTLVWCLILRRC